MIYVHFCLLIGLAIFTLVTCNRSCATFLIFLPSKASNAVSTAASFNDLPTDFAIDFVVELVNNFLPSGITDLKIVLKNP